MMMLHHHRCSSETMQPGSRKSAKVVKAAIALVQQSKVGVKTIHLKNHLVMVRGAERAVIIRLDHKV